MNDNLRTNSSFTAISGDISGFLTKIYMWMFFGLGLTGLTSWYVFQSGLWYSIIGTKLFFWGLIIGEFVLVYTLSTKIRKFSATTSIFLFLTYSVLNGLNFSVIFSVYSIASIEKVFWICSGMFAVMSAFGYMTKKDLSGMGRFMIMGFIGIIIATFVEFILGGFAPLHFAISVIGVIIFAGLTAYDTQKLKELYYELDHGSDLVAKAAIMGALTLYLDFINLFLFLLRLFGGSRD